MDAVLPLTARDVERFGLLWASLERRVTGLDTLWVVVPHHQQAQLKQALPSSGRNGCTVRVQSELDFLPTLRAFPRTGGWYRQMLLKLQAANHVASAFYLTLDADVLACRNVELDALCADGRAPCHVDHRDLHPKWYRAATNILGAPLPRANISHGVTPALLHAGSVRSMLDVIGKRWDGGAYGAGLRGLKQRWGKVQAWLYTKRSPSEHSLDNWCAYLCFSRPWAEYALYFSHLEQSGQFGHYFYEAPEVLYSVSGSVWHADAFAAWDPSPLFDGEGPPYFAVVQSNAFIAVREIEERLVGHLF